MLRIAGLGATFYLSGFSSEQLAIAAELFPRHHHRSFIKPKVQVCPPGQEFAPYYGPDASPLGPSPMADKPTREGATELPTDQDVESGSTQQRADATDDAVRSEPSQVEADFASTFQFASAPQSAAPNMIGDFFGGSTSNPSYVSGGNSTPVTALYSNVFYESDGDDYTILHPGGGQSGFPGIVLSDQVFGAGNLANPGTVLNVPAPGGLPEALLSALGSHGTLIVDPSNPSRVALVSAIPTGGPGPLSDSNGDGVDDSIQTSTVNGNARPAEPLIDPTDDDADYLADLQFYYLLVPQSIALNVPSPGAGAGVGRVKLAENTSPLPRDRVFFNYSYFDNVALTASGVDVNRFVPGFEKTFFDGMMSFEMRFPFASTLDSNITADGVTSDNNVEFGNVTAIYKALLHQDEAWAYSAGLQLTIPTADDVRVGMADGTDLVRVENESVHLMPYFGTLYAPNDVFFAQGFVQYDLDANGNPVYINDFTSGLTQVGRINDANFLYVDFGVGYWAYREAHPDARLTGIAPTVELHYNRAIQDTDVVRSGQFQVGNYADNIEILNLVVGTTFNFGQQTTLTAGYATPIGGGDDKDFDGELRLMFNHFYGQGNRFTRAQF